MIGFCGQSLAVPTMSGPPRRSVFSRFADQSDQEYVLTMISVPAESWSCTSTATT
jgi:hypothetical protein